MLYKFHLLLSVSGMMHVQSYNIVCELKFLYSGFMAVSCISEHRISVDVGLSFAKILIQVIDGGVP